MAVHFDYCIPLYGDFFDPVRMREETGFRFDNIEIRGELIKRGGRRRMRHYGSARMLPAEGLSEEEALKNLLECWDLIKDKQQILGIDEAYVDICVYSDGPIRLRFNRHLLSLLANSGLRIEFNTYRFKGYYE
jgi:hypothetical protein